PVRRADAWQVPASGKRTVGRVDAPGNVRFPRSDLPTYFLQGVSRSHPTFRPARSIDSPCAYPENGRHRDPPPAPTARKASMRQLSHYDYGAIYRTALKVNWHIDDVIGGEPTLNFRLRFLPDAWVDAAALDFLSEAEQLVVNHIRAHSYLYFLGFAAEYFLPFVVERGRAR